MAKHAWTVAGNYDVQGWLDPSGYESNVDVTINIRCVRCDEERQLSSADAWEPDEECRPDPRFSYRGIVRQGPRRRPET